MPPQTNVDFTPPAEIQNPLHDSMSQEVDVQPTEPSNRTRPMANQVPPSITNI